MYEITLTIHPSAHTQEMSEGKFGKFCGESFRSSKGSRLTRVDVQQTAGLRWLLPLPPPHPYSCPSLPAKAQRSLIKNSSGISRVSDKRLPNFRRPDILSLPSSTEREISPCTRAARVFRGDSVFFLLSLLSFSHFSDNTRSHAITENVNSRVKR